MEDLKDRYFGVERKLLVAREGGDAAAANHILVKYPYNVHHERDRKAALNLLMVRTARQEAEDAAVRGMNNSSFKFLFVRFRLMLRFHIHEGKA